MRSKLSGGWAEMHNVILESGMGFISDSAFNIEKSKLYTDLGDGISSVEFVRVKDGYLLFIEAKSSFPNPNNPDKDNYHKFSSAIKQICDKFKHSLNLFSSAKVGVAQDDVIDELPEIRKASLAFILVIRGHKSSWCIPITNSIIEALPSYLTTIWKPNIYVINEVTAINQGLVNGVVDSGI